MQPETNICKFLSRSMSELLGEVKIWLYIYRGKWEGCGFHPFSATFFFSLVCKG